MWEIWTNQFLPKALKSCPKSNKSPNLVTLDGINNCVSCLDLILLWKFLSVGVVLKPKNFCSRWGLNSWPRLQRSNVHSQVLNHSVIQAPQAYSKNGRHPMPLFRFFRPFPTKQFIVLQLTMNILVVLLVVNRYFPGNISQFLYILLSAVNS